MLGVEWLQVVDQLLSFAVSFLFSLSLFLNSLSRSLEPLNVLNFKSLLLVLILVLPKLFVALPLVIIKRVNLLINSIDGLLQLIKLLTNLIFLTLGYL